MSCSASVDVFLCTVPPKGLPPPALFLSFPSVSHFTFPGSAFLSTPGLFSPPLVSGFLGASRPLPPPRGSKTTRFVSSPPEQSFGCVSRPARAFSLSSRCGLSPRSVCVFLRAFPFFFVIFSVFQDELFCFPLTGSKSARRKQDPRPHLLPPPRNTHLPISEGRLLLRCL